MTDVVERAKAVLEDTTDGPWEQVGFGNIHRTPAGEHPPVAKTWNRANGEFIAQARTLVPELAAEVEELRAVVSADDSTAARIHRQWTQARRQVRELRAEVERLRKVTDIIDPDSVYQEQRDQYREQRDQARAELKNVRRRLVERQDEARTQLIAGNISEARYYAGRVDGLRAALSEVPSV